MSYQIDARLNGANPRLEVSDANSGAVRLIWEYPRAAADEGEAKELEREAAIEELFRRLFLLTTQDYLRSQR